MTCQIIQQPDAFGNAADSNVVAWFGAAAQANRGEGGASDLIRSYTYAQLFLRTGNEIEDISNVLQNASNAIANAVYGDIESSRENIDGEVYVKAREILYLEDKVVLEDPKDSTKNQTINYNVSGEILDEKGSPIWEIFKNYRDSFQ